MPDTDKLEKAPHLDELRRQIEQESEEQVAPPPPTSAKRDPRLLRQYTFEIDHRTPQGKVRRGEFTNRILTLGDQSKVGLMRARLGGGLPVSALDDLTVEINLMLAHLTFSLTKRPEWANDLQNLTDLEVVYKIYEEVAAHEATFRGGSITKAPGAEEDGQR